MALAEATRPNCARRRAGASTPNLDLVRLQAHVSRPELYDAADAAGMLLWQDFPLQWGYARGVRKRRCARPGRWSTCSATIRASCCGARTTSRSRSTSLRASRSAPAVRGLAVPMLPTWNKDVLDRSIAGLARADGAARSIAHSGVLPGLGESRHRHPLLVRLVPRRARTARGLWRAVPASARFVTEFGAQAVPDHAAFMEPGALARPRLGAAGRAPRAAEGANFDRRAARRYASRSPRGATPPRRTRPRSIQLQVEDLRRLKHGADRRVLPLLLRRRPPAVTWSVLDHERGAESADTGPYATRAGPCCR